tara:strand:+ start:247 stop:534 length:288 start_codon:yes stop_codon:yes gene_type:complete
MLSLDIAMKYDTASACASDDIDNAVNYAKVAALVDHFASAHQFDLIEALAEQICQLLLDQLPIQQLTLTIQKKPNDMKNVDHVGITMTRHADIHE